LILNGACGLILVGLSIGLPLSFAAGRLLATQMQRMNPYDPAITVTVALALGLSALLGPLSRRFTPG
jgi:hypothetical protein